MGEKVEDVSLYNNVWSANWEDGLTRLVSCVGKYYGLGLLRSDKTDVDALKKILEYRLFSFDERTEFRDAYDIPEKVMEYIIPSIAKYCQVFYHTVPRRKDVVFKLYKEKGVGSVWGVL